MLADLRPSTKMLVDMAKTVGIDHAVDEAAGRVTTTFMSQHVLAEGAVRTSGGLVDIDRPSVRQKLEVEHAQLLAKYGMVHLDLSQIRSQTRFVTQRISRGLFDRGESGIHFGSNHDSNPCYALFEGRALVYFDRKSRIVPLSTSSDRLRRVVMEYGLKLPE